MIMHTYLLILDLSLVFVQHKLDHTTQFARLVRHLSLRKNCKRPFPAGNVILLCRWQSFSLPFIQCGMKFTLLVPFEMFLPIRCTKCNALFSESDKSQIGKPSKRFHICLLSRISMETASSASTLSLTLNTKG
jgi:hypothetical protein